jgi:hypothetical protein
MKIILTESQFKTLSESVDGKSSLENLIYEFLNDDFYPDYNWGPELFDFYREDVKEHGLIPFYINDSEAYVYYDDGTLEIMPWICEKLNEYFNDLWYSVFKSWFEENSGLKVSMMVDPRNNNRLLQESIDNSNVVKQILDNEGIDVSISYGGRVPDKNVFYDYVYFLFKFSNTEVKPYKRVWFDTKNNKVVGIDSVPDFSTITDGFRYIPTEILNSYFVEKGEEYLNEILPIKYPKHNKLNESVDNSNIVEEIMKYAGIKYDGHEFLERSYDNFGRTHDTVIFYFRLPDDDFSYYRRIHFLTRNNKVISVDSAGDFRTIDDAFRYVPTDVLMNYFIEKGKTYLEKFLPKRYPTDSK